MNLPLFDLCVLGFAFGSMGFIFGFMVRRWLYQEGQGQ